METELGWEFVQIYGLTETTPLLTMNRGRAEYDDLDPGDRAAPARAAPARRRSACRSRIDDEGEVLARSNVVMDGYWDQPEATAARHRRRLVPHRRRRRRSTTSRYLTISDRKKDVIISGGENVSSIEVEDALFQHPDVAEVAVIGVPDEKWGELVTALVVAGARGRGLTEDDLIAFCQASAWPATSARSGSSSATSWPAPPPASCRSSSSASPSGPVRSARSTDASGAAGPPAAPAPLHGR